MNRNPGNLMSELEKDVNKNYRSKTKTQIDEISNRLPRMSDMRLTPVKEIKYSDENGVLNILHPGSEQAFFSVSGISWNYSNINKLKKEKMNSASSLLVEEPLSQCCLEKSVICNDIEGYRKNSLEIINPVLVFFFGELVPWANITVMITTSNTYFIINNKVYFPNVPLNIIYKSSAVANIVEIYNNYFIDDEKYPKYLINPDDERCAFEFMQFYTPIIYKENGSNEYTYTDVDIDMCKRIMIFGFRHMDNLVNRYNMYTNYSFSYLFNGENDCGVYKDPTTFREIDIANDDYIEIYLDYSKPNQPGAFIKENRIYYNYGDHDNGLKLVGVDDYNVHYGYESDGDIFVALCCITGVDINNDKDKIICKKLLNKMKNSESNINLNHQNVFISSSRRFGSPLLWRGQRSSKFNNNGKDYNGYYFETSGAVAISIPFNTNLTIINESSKADDKYLSYIECLDISLADSFNQVVRIAYPAFVSVENNSHNSADTTCYNTYSLDIDYVAFGQSNTRSGIYINTLVFFDTDGEQIQEVNNINKISNNMLKNSYKKYTLIDKANGYELHDTLSKDMIKSECIDEESEYYDIASHIFDFNNNYVSNKDFLTYSSLYDSGILMDTIKKFTPIFQSTFYVDSIDHKFYNDLHKSGYSFIYRGDRGEPNYLIEFINGTIPYDYSLNNHMSNKFYFTPNKYISDKGDTYEFIHFTNVHNRFFRESITGKEKSNGLEVIMNDYFKDYPYTEDMAKVFCYNLGDASYSNRELFVDSAGYQFYFEYPFNMTDQNKGIKIFEKAPTDNEPGVIIIVSKSGAQKYFYTKDIIKYKFNENKKYQNIDYGINDVSLVKVSVYHTEDGKTYISSIAIEEVYNIFFDTELVSIPKTTTNIVSLEYNDNGDLSLPIKIRILDNENVLSEFPEVAGAYFEKYNLILIKNEDTFVPKFTITIDIDDETTYYPIDQKELSRVYLNNVSDDEKIVLKKLSYENVLDFYGNKKYINYDGFVTAEPITYKTYGSDYYFNPLTENPCFEIECDYSDGIITPKDPNYIGEECIIVPETQFRYTKYYIIDPTVSIDLPEEFQFCRDHNRYLVFINGLLIDTANFRITTPKPNLPFSKVSLYISITINEGDCLEVFYLPNKLVQVEYQETMINNNGNITIDFGSIPSSIMQYVSSDTSMVFINGKKIPSTKINNISMNKISIEPSSIDSINNLIIYSFIPFFPMDNTSPLYELNRNRLEAITNPTNNNSMYNILTSLDKNDGFNKKFSSLWDSLVFGMSEYLTNVGGYNGYIDDIDINIFNGSVDDIAIVYEIIRDSYSKGIVTGVPFAYNYDDIIFEEDHDINGDNVEMEDTSGTNIINIQNAMLEHSYDLDRDFAGIDIKLPDISVENIGRDAVYIRYIPNSDSVKFDQSTGMYILEGLFTVNGDEDNRVYYVDTSLKGEQEGYIINIDAFTNK